MLHQSVKDAGVDNISDWAAAIAFYSLLSLFPLLLATISLSAFFVDQHWATERLIQAVGRFLPDGSSFIRGLVDEVMTSRAPASLLSIVTLLWAARSAFGALTTGLDIAFEVNGKYGFWMRIVIQLVMTFVLGSLFLLAVLTEPIITFLQGVIKILPGESFMIATVATLVPLLLMFIVFFCLYRFVPSERKHTPSAAFGALIALIGVSCAKPVFGYYVTRFARYNLVYGSLAIVIGLLVWAWIVATIILFGAEVSSHLYLMLIEGSDEEEIQERHEARAPVKEVPAK